MGGGEELPRNPRLTRQRFAPGASLQWDDGKRCQFGLCAPRSLAAATGEVMRSERRVIIIAGPNGAGKTTFAHEFLPHEADCPVFVNADLIAAGLAPFAPATAAIEAGRLMLADWIATLRRAAVLRSKPRCRGETTSTGSSSGSNVITGSS
ncbi:MAG: hypothetical protein LC098_08750 [Burkholderiales bacterium]|nr:hypothetical protein [Burkholderiales bacterium]